MANSKKDKTGNEDNEKIRLRITDLGAIEAVMETVNQLIHIRVALTNKPISSVKEYVEYLQNSLKKYLIWLDRVPDATLYKRFSKNDIETIKKDAKEVLTWDIIPTEKQIKRRQKLLNEYKEKQDLEPEAPEEAIKVLIDTSFLLSYQNKKDVNHKSTKVIIEYLKTQHAFFDYHLPNIVFLELITQLRRKYTFAQTKKEFDKLLDDISDYNIVTSKQELSMFEIFQRHEAFARNKLSSNLRSNDFFIATEGILAESIILTCDKKMYEEVYRSYKKIFLINRTEKSYIQFINSFEKLKKKNSTT